MLDVRCVAGRDGGERLPKASAHLAERASLLLGDLDGLDGFDRDVAPRHLERGPERASRGLAETNVRRATQTPGALHRRKDVRVFLDEAGLLLGREFNHA